MSTRVASVGRGLHEREGSGNSSSFPSISSPTDSKDNVRQNREKYIVEGASERPDLKGIVDLTNTVDTTVTTRQLPGKNIVCSPAEVRPENQSQYHVLAFPSPLIRSLSRLFGQAQNPATIFNLIIHKNNM